MISAMDSTHTIKQMLEACQNDDIQKATTLLDAGFNVNTVLQGADPFSNKEPVVSYAFHRCTLLHWAAKEGKVDFARTLLLRGANKNARDYFGNTPLVYAIKAVSPVFDLLLDEGADIVTPMIQMDDCRPIDIAVNSLQPRMVKKLIERGGDVLKASLNKLRFKSLGYALMTLECEKIEKTFGLENPDYVETCALDIIELLRTHGELHSPYLEHEGTVFHDLGQLKTKRYVCALIAPLMHEGKRKEAYARLFAFLCVNNRFGHLRLPREVYHRIFSHSPIDCKYSGLEETFVPKEERRQQRTRFLDECWPLLPSLVSQEEAALLYGTLSIKTPLGKQASELTKDPEMQNMLNPKTWKHLAVTDL